MSTPAWIAIWSLLTLGALIGLYRVDRTVLPPVLATTVLLLSAAVYTAVLLAL